MKILWSAILIFLVICIFVGVHTFVMSRMGESLNEKNTQIKNLAEQDKWEEVEKKLIDVENEWESYSTWASLTISTDDIEQLEISLAQSKVFAKMKQKTNFFGEFIMFSKLVEHIPHKEGLHIEEIL